MTKNTMKYFNRLIGKIAVKDEKALEALYDIYGKLIYVTAMTVTKSTFKADEIVDDVLVKIWKNADKLPKIKNPEGWLYSMTVNCAKDKIKCEKQYVELFDLQEDGSVGDYPEDDFYNKISTLDETEQEIMILKFVDDLTFKKIAKAMGKPLSTITSVYYRALEKLK